MRSARALRAERGDRLRDPAAADPAIIPHTREHTHLADLAVGDRVHLEADILAKHVEKLVKP